MKQELSQPFMLHRIRKRLLLTAILVVVLALAGVATALAAPAALTGDLSVNTATVGKTVNQTLTLDGATSGSVSSITITRPANWGAPTISSVKFTDAGGSPTILVVNSSTSGQVTTITITSSGGTVTFDNAGDKIEIAFSTTAPNTPAACTAFGVSVSDGATSAAVTADAGGDCGDKLQVRVHHDVAAKFQVDVPQSGVFAANVAVAGEARPGIVITAQDSLGNTVDDSHGATPYTNGLNVTTNPSVSASVLVTATNGVTTTSITPTSGGTVKVVATDKSNSAITGQSADVLVAAPVISVSNGNGGANEAQTVTGTGDWGTATWTIKENTLMVAGAAATHAPIVVNASGQFAATSITRAAALPRGQYDVMAQVWNSAGTVSQYTKTFKNAFSISPKLVKFARPGDPAPAPTGANGETVQFQGTGFTANVTPAITLVDASGKEFLVTGAVNSTAAGNFGGTVNLVLPALPEGVYDLRINDGQVNDFDINWTVAPNIVLNPAISDGLIGDVVNNSLFSGFAFPANLAKGSTTITIGGASVSGDELLTTDGFGQFNGGATQQITLTSQLAAGIHDVVVTTPTRVDRTFASKYRVPSLAGTNSSGNPGGGTPGEAATFKGDFFLPNHNMTGATIAVGSGVGSKFTSESGTAVTGITVDANGKFTATVTITAGLPQGKRTVLVTDGGGQKFYFPNAYEVVPTLQSITPARVVRGSTVPVAVAITVSGLPKNGTVVANTITIGGQATTHDPANIDANGNLAVTVNLTALPAAGLNAVVIPVQGGSSVSFANAFGVMDVTADPAAGQGAPGTKIKISGVGFEPNKDVVLNSIMVGTSTTTHSAFKVGADGSFATEVTLVSNLSQGTYNVVADGQTFDKEYIVGANVTVNPAYGDGRSGAEAIAHGGFVTATTTLSGSGFKAGDVIAKDSITVGGKATTHSAVTVAGDGSFTVVLTLPGLDPGAHAVAFTVGTTPFTSGNIYHVAELTLTPVARTFNQNFMIAGSHLLPNAAVQAGLKFRDTSGNTYNLTLGGVAETNASGVLPSTFINLQDGILPSGPLGLDVTFMNGSTVQYLFPGIYNSAGEPPLVTVNPDRGDGRAGNTVTVSVQRLAANKTIPSNSITFGGQATQHFAFKTTTSGNYSGLSVKLPALPAGMHDVVVDTHTQAKAYTVATAKLSPNTGNGANNETVDLSGSYFPANDTSVYTRLEGPIISDWQPMVSTNANGDIAQGVNFGWLPTGVYSLTINPDSGIFFPAATNLIFPSAYTVSPKVNVNPVNGAGNEIVVSGTGYNSGAQVPANSITVQGTTSRGINVPATATTHAAFQVNRNGSFAAQTITVPGLTPGNYSITIAGQTVNIVVTSAIGPAASVVLAASPETIVANGSTTSTISITVQDANGKPVANQFVSLETSLGYINSGVTTGADGKATAILTSGTVAGVAQVFGMANNVKSAVRQVNFTAGPPASVEAKAEKGQIPADGVSNTVVTVTVKDVNGNLVGNQEVAVSTSLGSIAPAATVTTNAQGQADVILVAGTQTGTAKVTATAGAASGSVDVVLGTLKLFMPRVGN